VKGEIGASIGEVGAGFARVAWRALVLLLAVGLVAEVALRAKGLQPQNLYRVGFSAVVIDRWTEWAMRPGVRLNEYAVTNAYGLHEDREINLAPAADLGMTTVLVGPYAAQSTAPFVHHRTAKLAPFLDRAQLKEAA